MKINRLVALVIVALLVVAAMGAITMSVLAQSSSAPVVQGGENPKAGEAESNESGAVPAGITVITLEQAKAAALTAHPGVVTFTELEGENGQWIYTVEFEDGVEVEIDAVTGAVLRNGPED